jgi:hypothetical protein
MQALPSSPATFLINHDQPHIFRAHTCQPEELPMPCRVTGRLSQHVILSRGKLEKCVSADGISISKMRVTKNTTVW